MSHRRRFSAWRTLLEVYGWIGLVALVIGACLVLGIIVLCAVLVGVGPRDLPPEPRRPEAPAEAAKAPEVAEALAKPYSFGQWVESDKLRVRVKEVVRGVTIHGAKVQGKRDPRDPNYPQVSLKTATKVEIEIWNPSSQRTSWEGVQWHGSTITDEHGRRFECLWPGVWEDVYDMPNDLATDHRDSFDPSERAIRGVYFKDVSMDSAQVVVELSLLISSSAGFDHPGRKQIVQFSGPVRQGSEKVEPPTRKKYYLAPSTFNPNVRK